MLCFERKLLHLGRDNNFSGFSVNREKVSRKGGKGGKGRRGV